MEEMVIKLIKRKHKECKTRQSIWPKNFDATKRHQNGVVLGGLMLHRILGDVMYLNELIVAYYCLTLPILFS